MTTTKRFGLLGLLGGLALTLTTAAGAGHGRPPKRSLVELSIFDGKGFFGKVVRDGDRFVALRIRMGDDKLGYLDNFEKSDEELWVDDRSLGYDLRGKNKNVLVRERSAEDTRWEFVMSKKKEEPFRGRFRAKNGELKGWWIGLGVEPGKKGSELPRDQYPRARLILVKDKKDAAGFSWSLGPPDDGR
jgi:hypothetical protein